MQPLRVLSSGNQPVFGNILRPKFGQSHIPVIPQQLRDVLQAVPKTELHLHLSGSAPIGVIRDIFRETEPGLTEDEILAKTQRPDWYTGLDNFLYDYYYKIPSVIKTQDHFRRAAKAVILEAADENVRYIEIRSSILSKDENSTPQQLVEAIEGGIREGIAEVKQKKGWTMQSGLIILAQRGKSAEESLESAKKTVELADRPGSMIRGFDLAGSEGQFPVTMHKEALDYFNKYGRPKGLKLTIHAGETPNSQELSGVDSIRQALSLGADRIGHGLEMMNDPELLKEMVANKVPVELCPWSNVQIQAVKPYTAHPLPGMLKAGVNASLNTDNRMMSKITLTDQLAQLYSEGLLTCWQQLKTLTYNGVQGAFMGDCERKQLMSQVKRQFTLLEKRSRGVINQFFCKTCTHEAIPTGKGLSKVA